MATAKGGPLRAGEGSRVSRKRTAGAEDYFFLAMALWIATVVFVGFSRTYYLAGIFRVKLASPLVHVHGALFSTWIVMLLAQTGLVFAKRLKWHMKLGLAGMALAPLMVAVGFATTLAASHRNFAGRDTATILAYEMMNLVFFAAFTGWAYRSRMDRATHKRAIVLATVALLGPALSRWPYAWLESDAVFYLTLDSFLILLVAFDLVTRKNVHRVTLIGTAAILAIQAAAHPIAGSGAFQDFLRWVQAV